VKAISFIALALLLTGGAADAGEVSGNAALALAALIAPHSQHITASEKALLAKYLEGQAKATFPAGKKISVDADAVTCRISDVNITEHSCELTFGAKKVSFAGGKAQALYATLVEAGVPSDGAAGSILEGVSRLGCTISPEDVRQESGGGASCTYNPGR